MVELLVGLIYLLVLPDLSEPLVERWDAIALNKLLQARVIPLSCSQDVKHLYFGIELVQQTVVGWIVQKLSQKLSW